MVQGIGQMFGTESMKKNWGIKNIELCLSIYKMQLNLIEEEIKQNLS